MKTTFIKTLFAAFIILVSASAKIKAQNYYPVYLCDNASATLRIPEESGLTSGDKVHWYLDNVEVGVNTYNGTANSTEYVTTNIVKLGVNNFRSKIESVAGCMGELSEPFQVYQLPGKTIALTSSLSTYCGSDASLSSVITATTTPGQALPAGIGYEYVWTATKDGTAVSPLSGIGTDDASKTELNKFTLTTSTAGTYAFVATVKYITLTGNTALLKSGDTKGCEVTAAPTTVKVTPKPVKPTIVVQ